ncbi:MAG: sulfite exporter TauE/SafE family protein [Syntrophales bacterium]
MSFLIGLLAGTFGGLLGGGGGVIMIPLMVYRYKLIQRQAHGTSLFALVFTGLSGAATYAFNNSVDYTAALLLAATAVPMTRLGARYCHSLAEWKLKRYFGFFLIVIAVLLVAKPYYIHFSHSMTGWAKVAVLLFIGLFTGFFSGMMGIGGGAIMIPAMVLLIGMSQHIAQGSSLLCMVPAGAVGAFTHRRLGNIADSILPGLISGILIGAFLGGNVAVFLPEGVLRIIYSAVVIWTGLRYAASKEAVCED